MRVLVVEDEKDLNRLIVKTLKKEGYSVDGCFNGEEAMLNLMGAEYDAIILDVMMPKMNGFDVIKELRDKSEDIPVLFLTAKDSVADRVKGLPDADAPGDHGQLRTLPAPVSERRAPGPGGAGRRRPAGWGTALLPYELRRAPPERGAGRGTHGQFSLNNSAASVHSGAGCWAICRWEAGC